MTIDRGKLAELQEKVTMLNAAADSINDLLAKAEEDLKGTGVEVWVSGGPKFFVGYAKIGTDWHLASRGKDFGSEPQAITSCTREVRIAALEKLDAIVDALNKKAEELIDRAALAVAQRQEPVE